MKLVQLPVVLGLAAVALAEERPPILGKPISDCYKGMKGTLFGQFSKFQDLIYNQCLELFDINYDVVVHKTRQVVTRIGTLTTTYTTVVPVTIGTSGTVTVPLVTTTTTTTTVTTATPLLNGRAVPGDRKNAIAAQIIKDARLDEITAFTNLKYDEILPFKYGDDDEEEDDDDHDEVDWASWGSCHDDDDCSPKKTCQCKPKYRPCNCKQSDKCKCKPKPKSKPKPKPRPRPVKKPECHCKDKETCRRIYLLCVEECHGEPRCEEQCEPSCMDTAMDEIIDACRCLLDSRPLPAKETTRTVRKTSCSVTTATASATITASITTLQATTTSSTSTITQTSVIPDNCQGPFPGYSRLDRVVADNFVVLGPTVDAFACCRLCQSTLGCVLFRISTVVGPTQGCALVVQFGATADNVCPAGVRLTGIVAGPDGAVGFGQCGIPVPLIGA